MTALIVEKIVIQNDTRTELFAVATSERNPHSVRTSLTYEAHLTEWTTDRVAAEKLKAEIEAAMPAFKVTRSDGASYVTSMAQGVTLQDARAYFIGQSFTDEDANGKETKWTATAVEMA